MCQMMTALVQKRHSLHPNTPPHHLCTTLFTKPQPTLLHSLPHPTPITALSTPPNPSLKGASDLRVIDGSLKVLPHLCAAIKEAVAASTVSTVSSAPGGGALLALEFLEFLDAYSAASPSLSLTQVPKP